jgi:hypothetical protein
MQTPAGPRERHRLQLIKSKADQLAMTSPQSASAQQPFTCEQSLRNRYVRCMLGSLLPKASAQHIATVYHSKACCQSCMSASNWCIRWLMFFAFLAAHLQASADEPQEAQQAHWEGQVLACVGEASYNMIQ